MLFYGNRVDNRCLKEVSMRISPCRSFFQKGRGDVPPAAFPGYAPENCAIYGFNTWIYTHMDRGELETYTLLVPARFYSSAGCGM